MPAVISDTGPLHYLVLIAAVELMPELFGTVCIPYEVASELSHGNAPASVRQWILAPPPWLLIHGLIVGPPNRTSEADRLDNGEREVLALAMQNDAGLLVMDDREAVGVARKMGLSVMGTLGVLDFAARRGLTDLAGDIAQLRQTNFRCRAAVMDDVLTRFEADRTREVDRS